MKDRHFAFDGSGTDVLWRQFRQQILLRLHGSTFAKEHNLSLDHNKWTRDMKMLFKLTYG